jgi:transcription elongation factor SPT5
MSDKHQDIDLSDDDEFDEESEQSEEEIKTKARKKISGRRKHLKTKKKVKLDENPLSKFYEEQASEDSEEEEDYDEDEVSEGERKMAKAMENRMLPSRQRNSRLDFVNLEGEELENAMKQKEDAFNSDIEIEEGNTELASAGLLPTPRDPHIFAVKCKQGLERDAVLEVTKKYFDSMGTAQEFQMFSATCVDKTQGYIYIEARSNAHVYRAIQGIPLLDGRYVKIIHPNDRIQIFESDQTKKNELQPFQYVRLKRGLYEGDLAQVIEIYDNRNKVMVRMVPRLAPEDKEENNQSDDEEEKGSEAKKDKKKFQENARKRIRPPQRLFLTTEYQNYEKKRDIDSRRSFYVYKKQNFADGLLYKKVTVKTLLTENVNPTIEEIQMFAQALGEKDDKLYDQLADFSKKTHKFHKGDKVRVIKGELTNLEGIVTKATDKEVTVIPTIEDLKDPIEFLPTDLVKSFRIGDSVKVVAGKSAGKMGFIITIEDNIARIKTDDLRNDIEVYLNDLILAEEGRRNVATDNIKNQMENYRKFDLVLLNDSKTFGCIIGLDETSAKMVDNHGYVQTINAYQIQWKVNTRNNVTKNDLKQVFASGASAKVLEGFNKGRVGTIKHVYQDVVFLFSVDCMETAGIFVEKANNCYLLSSMQKQQQRPQPGPQGQTHIPKNSLVGQRCGIVAGPWKGYQGIVKEANERNVRIELMSKCKTIDCPTNLVKPVSQINDNKAVHEDTFVMEPKTPMHGKFNPQSPYPLQSPGFDASPAWAGGEFGSPSYESHLK